MTILERLLRHDAWSTRSLLTLSSALTDAELDCEFDIGHRTLRRTFVHMIENMECWCDLMKNKPQRKAGQTYAPPNSVADLIARLAVVSEELVELGKRVEKENRQDDFFIDDLERPPRRKPLGAGLVHIATHGMHHRAHCLCIMRQLGMKRLIEGDALSWERIHRGLDQWPLA